MQQTISFPSGQVNYIFEDSIAGLQLLLDKKNFVFITDSNIAGYYPELFAGQKSVIIPSGESSKCLETIENITVQLLQLEATRKTTLVGVGGGVITDITGFVASTYMRGVDFGFVPTTLLCMVDASIGGKNGVNVGFNKNILGSITQPSFIYFNTCFLETLPVAEWSNGFAEIIKYACIFDKELFQQLDNHHISYYQQNNKSLAKIIQTCVQWKNNTVIADEKEAGIRKLLNFGHTAGHAIETLYELPHGQAVAIGMVIAARLSELVTSFPGTVTSQLQQILMKYNLPIDFSVNVNDVMRLLKMDKKRKNNEIEYIVLEKIGQAIIQPLSFEIIKKAIATCAP